MASSGYADETEFESIWDISIATTRFNNLNLRIGEILNFMTMGDESTDTTDTKVTTILRHITEDIIIRIVSLSRVQKNDPLQLSSILSLARIEQFYGTYLEKVARILGQTETIEIASLTGFGANNSM